MSPIERLRQRSTPDLIAIAFAGVIILVVLTAVIGGVVWRIVDPEDADLEKLINRVGGLVNTMVGAVVGYLAGRGVIPNDKSSSTTLFSSEDDPE